MVLGEKREKMLLKRKFPYSLKPLLCRMQEDKKQAINKKMIYIKCNKCGGFIEIWTDEKTGYCLDCGMTIQIPSPVQKVKI